MTYVVTEPCIRCKYTDCVAVCPVEAFKEISDALREEEVDYEEADLRMMPNQEIELDSEQTLKVMHLIEELEDLDDVQRVSSNLNVSEEAVAILEVA